MEGIVFFFFFSPLVSPGIQFKNGKKKKGKSRPLFLFFFLFSSLCSEGGYASCRVGSSAWKAIDREISWEFFSLFFPSLPSLQFFPHVTGKVPG